ncbi:hypothetical protein NXC24_PB00495 (plasmid) [Rhizobium sp. NXC24]|nr:hypothetical protein NXC24_PB00495 [Rhizobium sp. NXC24]
MRLLRLRYFPLLARREFPKSRPRADAHADFSDTLHYCRSALLAALRAGRSDRFQAGKRNASCPLL